MGDAALEFPADTSVLLSLLTARQERRDTRVFAHAAAETQVAIKEAYGSRPTTRAGTNALATTEEAGFLEVFPRVASRPPKLLQELEALLVERLRSNDKATSIGPLVAKDRDTRMSANLSLHAHRQVFAAFIAGFGTYALLLERVQAEFEFALNEGVRCAMENVDMRRRMAEEEVRRAKAGAEIRAKIMAEEQEYRKEAFVRTQELKQRMDRATKRAAAADRELQEVRKQEQQLQALVSQLRESNTKLQALQRAEQVWSLNATSPVLGGLKIGPLSREDEAWLDQEYTTSVKSPLAAAAAAIAATDVAASESAGKEMVAGSFIADGHITESNIGISSSQLAACATAEIADNAALL